MVNMSVKGLDSFVRKMKMYQHQMPRDVDKFMSKESKILINQAKQASPYATFKKRWFTKTRKGSQNSIWKGIFNKAPHLHLILDGHMQVGHRPDKKVYGRVNGNNFLKSVIDNFETQFEVDMEKFMNGVFE